jgi:hypothetical protein
MAFMYAAGQASLLENDFKIDGTKCGVVASDKYIHL